MVRKHGRQRHFWKSTDRVDECGFARSVFAADLDGDGDMDLASASLDDDKIVWYENTDGKGTFGSQQIVSTSDGSRSVFAADLDGDGDMDLASASYLTMTIKLHGTKTQTAKEPFGSQQIVSTTSTGYAQ